jgi:hypothetical protein
LDLYFDLTLGVAVGEVAVGMALYEEEEVVSPCTPVGQDSGCDFERSGALCSQEITSMYSSVHSPFPFLSLSFRRHA